jgi:predicted esterase
LATTPWNLPLPPHKFHRGTNEGAPLLLAIPGRADNQSDFLNFCRSISPGCSILAPATARSGDEYADDMARRADDLALLITTVLALHEVALMPVVAVGHAEGANVATNLIARHGHIPSAALLLRPTRPMPFPNQSLDGLDALLAAVAGSGTSADAARQIWQTLAHGGARVICEHLPRSRMVRKRDAPIARIFISALFS